MIYSVIAVFVICLAGVEWSKWMDLKAYKLLLEKQIEASALRELAFDKERQTYLDRLSAGSFTEFKTQQIRMTKARQKEEPVPVMELL